jgi:hypothetical protein
MIYDKNYKIIRENDLVEFDGERFNSFYVNDKLVLRNIQREVYIEDDTISYEIKSLEYDADDGWDLFK